MMFLYELRFAKLTVSIVSVNEPIWFTLTKTAFATPFSIPSCKRFTFVTNKSSPTNWHLEPINFVCSAQPAQSSSAIPSSIEMIGYLSTQVFQ